MANQKTRMAMAIFGMVLLYLAGVFVRGSFGIRTTIRNESGETIRNMEIVVPDDVGKNHKYWLGQMTPGSRARVYVQPVAASGIELQFMDSCGGKHVQNLGVYVEMGYCGSIQTIVMPLGYTQSNSHIDPIACWRSWLDFVL